MYLQLCHAKISHARTTTVLYLFFLRNVSHVNLSPYQPDVISQIGEIGLESTCVNVFSISQYTVNLRQAQI